MRQRIGYIGQKDGAGYNYRVRDELLMQGRFYGLSKDEAAASRLVRCSPASTSTAWRCARSSTLSGGQKRRLDIALGLIHEPALLFLDEPSTGMDPQNRANLWEHIMRLREEHGTTIVLTTHYLEEADSMAERVVVIDHGRIIADDTAEALKAKQAGDRITLTVGAADVRHGARGRRPGRPELTESRTDDGLRIDFRVESGDPDAASALLHALGDKGVDVLEASAHQPTLDDVFLNLTGRSLREAVETGAEA